MICMANLAASKIYGDVLVTRDLKVFGSIEGSLTGNAYTATKLETARNINGVSFDGSSSITITANTPNTLTRGTGLTGNNFNGGSATTWAVSYGTSAGTACEGNDSRLSDARPPTAHTHTHASTTGRTANDHHNQVHDINGSDHTSTLAVDKGGTGQTSYTNGQLLIGNTTGNTLTKATLTAGENVTITNGAGSITIASTDTVYTHPTGNGNNHIPAGGSSGNILQWLSQGTAQWKTNGTNSQYLRGDGSWATPPNTNTASAANNILKGSNSGTQITYAPYTDSQATSLRFYTHATNPTGTSRLNLGGYFYATRLYDDGTRVVTTNDSRLSDARPPTAHTHTHASTTGKTANDHHNQQHSIDGSDHTGTLSVGKGGTGSTSFTAGRVLFGNGSSTINTSSNLHWDNTNSRLGIGTTTPSEKLEVSGNISASNYLHLSNGSNRMSIGLGPLTDGLGNTASDNDTYIRTRFAGSSSSHNIHTVFMDSGGLIMYGPSATGEIFRIQNGGNVGMGTTSPNEKLEVAGFTRTSSGYKVGTNTVINSTLDFSGRQGTFTGNVEINESVLSIRKVASGNGNMLDLYGWNTGHKLSIGYDTPGPYWFETDGDETRSDIEFRNVASGTQLMIKQGGDVGIGTTTPTAKLDVSGDIKSSDSILVTKLNSGGEGAVLDLRNPSANWHSTTNIKFRRNVPSSAGGTDMMGEIEVGSQSASGGRSYMNFKARRQSQSDIENVMTIWEDNVGIGSVFGRENNTPTQKLDVRGNIRGDQYYIGTTRKDSYWDAKVDRSGDTMTNKLTISNSEYQSHLDLVRGAIKFELAPSTANSGELRFLSTNATRYQFDKSIEVGGNAVVLTNDSRLTNDRTPLSHGDEKHNHVKYARITFATGTSEATFTHGLSSANCIVQLSSDSPSRHFYYEIIDNNSIKVYLDVEAFEEMVVNVTVTKANSITTITA